MEPPTPLDRLAAMLNAPAPLPWAERVRIYLDALQHASEIGRPLLRASLQIHLAKALLDDRSGTRAESIEQAITALSEAVGIFRDRSYSIPRAEAWTLLASAHLERIRGVRQENVEAAIRFCRRAFQVQNRRSRPDSWAEVADCLAGALAARSRKHRAIDQGKSLELFRRVLLLRRKDPAGWVSTAVNFAKALSESISGDRSGNIVEAIRLLRRAEEVLSGKRDASPKWATVQINLAVMYREHLRGDRTAHREQAIEILSRILALPSVPPLDRARAQDHLSVLLVERTRGRRADNLARAIESSRQALEVHTFEHLPQRWVETTLNLATAHAERQLGDGIQDLEQAIALYQQILDRLGPQEAPEDWTTAASNLATALAERRTGDRKENLREAVTRYRQVLEIRRDTDPRGWALTAMHLGNAFARLDLTGEPGAFEAAAEAYRQALAVHQISAFPGEHRRTQGNLADLLFAGQLWPEALEAYRAALAAGDIVYQSAATPEARRAALRAGLDYSIRAAWCLARLGQPGEAAVLLERSRTRSLNEALGQTEALLQKVPDLLRDRLLAARERVVSLEAASYRLEPTEHEEFLRLTEKLGQGRAALAEILEEIRQAVPDFLPDGMSSVAEASPARRIGIPLVYLLTTAHGSLAVLLDPTGEIASLFLDRLTEDHLRVLLHGGNGETSYLHLIADGDARSLQEALDRCGPLLQDRLLFPLAEQLVRRGFRRACLVPCGSLGLLPLAALAPEELVLQISPSARALEAVQARRRDDRPSRLMAAGDPPSRRPLAFAAHEAKEIADLFPPDGRQVLLGREATLARIRQELGGTTHLHLSCHGHFRFAEPLRSSIDLGGGEPLYLRDLFDPGLDLTSLRLVVLSACQTGITDQELPDEALGFPAAFLQAGVPAVVSTLWPVDDAPTALLLIRFYQHHLVDRMEPALALRQAQIWLRTSTVRELRLVEHCERILRESRSPHPTVYQWWRRYQKQPEAIPFQNPYFWAGFAITGFAHAPGSEA